MSHDLRARLFQEMDSWVLIDPHTHINPLSPASTTLADVLGYHYYTELAHSAGLPREQIEAPGLPPKEKVHRLVQALGPIENTIQYSWLVEMCQRFFGLADDRLTADNWEKLFDHSAQVMARPRWADEVLKASRIEAVFLTNDFDDSLEGFDTDVYIPCLRTDELVFKMNQSSVQDRLQKSSGVSVTDLPSLRQAIGATFERFIAKGARACAISLPPSFSPRRVPDSVAEKVLPELLKRNTSADSDSVHLMSLFVFWTLAEFCAEQRLPFDLMIGVNRSIYASGVYQGQDLYDSRLSLIQYRELFNAFPQVTFPISVLASVTNQELTSYSWIFPNVVTNGHWWYSNTPNYIEFDAAARLEAVPATKQIAYYSDMYKLEFALPKFAMYKRILAKILAERFVLDRGWCEERALTLARQVLRGNVERIFPRQG